ncbi:helix-turn-helix domain-containing protein [uncultured Tateyamaria sp.]|uniref:helix-turn-helix domain-containing protein n=1 Tax=uncultured Tateyamaria sp. TaxID=455651 RepID=UPI00262D820B|nr:AraC family transcriptional regulator [uncultured Tateyamaria sp.]
MSHHAAVLKEILNIPTITPVPDPCTERGSRQAQERRGYSLSTSAYDRIVTWMRARIDEHITEEMLCELSPMGKFAFRRAFEAHAGMPPMLYLMWMRVDMAVRLLIDTRFDLNQIAYVTGLHNAEELTNACLQTLRVRPQALRVSVAL